MQQVTVYNKGAEVIRMMRTLIGKQKFREGMELYFDRNDGNAVTCDDFRQAMADASGKDLTQFERWYLQAGTPTVTATSSYDAASKVYSLTLSQSTPPTPMQPEKLPFHIPVNVGLLGSDGSLLASATLELIEESQTFTFEGIAEEPVPSLLRDFSAPVKLKSEVTDEQLAFLAANDDDPFNRWDASQRLYTKALLELVASYQACGGDEAKMAPLAPSVLAAFSATLNAEGLDPSLKAYSLAMPDFSTLAQEMDVIDPDAITTALKIARRTLASENREKLLQIYRELSTDAPYEFTEGQSSARRLRNTCLTYLSKLCEEETTQLCLEQFRAATCMTDSIASLSCLANLPGPARDEALTAFYERSRANNELLSINKWLSVQAMADTPTVLADVIALTQNEAFDANNPNNLRALINTFASANPAAFHKIDGSGYEFIADQVIAIDKRNAQAAAGLARSFTTWRRFDEARQAIVKAQLERVLAEASSNDVKEMIEKTLKN